MKKRNQAEKLFLISSQPIKFIIYSLFFILHFMFIYFTIKSSVSVLMNPLSEEFSFEKLIIIGELPQFQVNTSDNFS